jgi:hypothetical protein
MVANHASSVSIFTGNCDGSQPVQDQPDVHGEPAAALHLRGDPDEAGHAGGDQRDLHPHQVRSQPLPICIKTSIT